MGSPVIPVLSHAAVRVRPDGRSLYAEALE